MKKLFKILFILLLIAPDILGQFAIINDKDGYTNLRENADIKSKTIYKLHNYELFLYEDSHDNSDWIKVFVPKNKYSLDCDGFSYLIGYIHRSRLKPIEELEKYKKDNFNFHYYLDTFNFSNKIIDYVDNKWISKINGRRFFGTDGPVPNIEVTRIDIQVNGNVIQVPQILYQDLFELTNDFNIYIKDDVYFVQQWNSDGAGGYLLVWVINKNSIGQRLIFIP